MRLKSKYITLVALIALTATPRALEQLSELKTRAQERFRTELLNVFWNFTTPETRPADARYNSELLARMQAAEATRCNGSTESRTTTRNAVARSSAWRATPPASDLGHRQPLITSDMPVGDFIAAAIALPEMDGESLEPVEHTSAGNGMSAKRDRHEAFVFVARNQKRAASFDDATAPPQLDNAVAQYEWSRVDETAPVLAAQPASLLKRGLPNPARLVQKFVQTNFQIRLPENLERQLNESINNETFIKPQDALTPAKAKCRVRVLRLTPEIAPRTLEKPALIS